MNQDRSIMSIVFTVSDWFMRIVKLNIAWLLTSLLGLLIFGLFPATYAAFYVADRWIHGDVDIKIWRTFFKAFRRGYLHSQLLGIIISAGIFILCVDILFFRQVKSQWVGTIVIVLLVILLICLIIIAIYMYPIKVSFDLNVRNTFKTAFFSGLSHLQWTFFNILGVAGILFVTYLFPATVFFLTGGSIILWMSIMSYIIQKKIKEKYEEATR